MPKTVISFRYVVGTNPYTTDIGTELNVTTRFNLPPDLDLADGGNIVAAVGGTINTESLPCSDANQGDLRKLIFIRESGNTMSVAVPLKANIITAATTIKSILDSKTDNSVVCIKLEGEYFPHLSDQLGLTYNVGDVAKSHKAPSTAKKQNYISGPIQYGADVGSSSLHPVRSITDKITEEPASQLGGEWDSCTGGIKSVVACGNGRRNPRKHRRFILKFVTQTDIASVTETPQTETIEVPVSSSVPSEIQTCGTDLAALAGAYCIGYKGESYSRVHQLLP